MADERWRDIHVRPVIIDYDKTCRLPDTDTQKTEPITPVYELGQHIGTDGFWHVVAVQPDTPQFALEMTLTLEERKLHSVGGMRYGFAMNASLAQHTNHWEVQRKIQEIEALTLACAQSKYNMLLGHLIPDLESMRQRLEKIKQQSHT